jgi:Ca2+:H+ antiporter
MRRFLITGKKILFHSWVNVLLVFVPVGIAVHFAGINENVVFAINAIAIVPLAGLLTFATESVAHRLGPTLGALINVSFGNAVELIIFIIALVKNEIRIVQASLIGSILANLLLILGMAFLIGGLEYQEQVYDSTVTQLSACLLALAVLSLLIPTAFHASFNDNDLANRQVLKLSRGTSVILLVVYILYLLFQLKSHAYLYKGVSQQVIDEQSQPGFLSRFDSTSSSLSSTASSRTGSERKVSKRQRIHAKLGKKRHEKVEVEDAIEEASPRTRNTESAKETEKAITFDEFRPQTPTPGMQKSQTDPVATGAGASVTSARPDTTSRGLSLRPPPVFRKKSEGLPQAQRHSLETP